LPYHCIHLTSFFAHNHSEFYRQTSSLRYEEIRILNNKHKVQCVYIHTYALVRILNISNNFCRFIFKENRLFSETPQPLLNSVYF